MAEITFLTQSTVLEDSASSSKTSGYIRLMRPANLVTAAADSLTGWVVVGGKPDSLIWLVASSICLYAGGVILNDFFDRHLDALERPERPLPAGAVSSRAAATLGAFFLFAGIAAGFSTSTTSGAIAVVIALMVLLYDVVAKHHAIGTVVMGSCRALNLLLGLSAIPGMLSHIWFLALLPLIYIGGITMLSRGEVLGGTRIASVVAIGSFSIVVAGSIALQTASVEHLLHAAPFILLLVVKVAPSLWRAHQIPQPTQIRAAVHAGIVSLIVLDSAIAAGYGGFVTAAAILSLTVVTAELGRLFPIT